MLAVPLAVAARYDQCPENYSCYYAGPDGNSTPWLAPTAGKHVLPFKVYSLRNRGHGDVYLKNDSNSRPPLDRIPLTVRFSLSKLKGSMERAVCGRRPSIL
jgi:hypothetical protein